ncbi:MULTISPECIES: GNAT family N-acetyltransferase [Rhizobium]|uniref:GNAT family N-acetyltransferase n=1 Tax=Rhizobium TaxID=379 RepID=UPI001A9955FD|nr:MULTISPECIES: GNAT family N-acetyltransferase [Rhizobium]MBX4893906.1 GNAT family N-acetyltransferase [Rhizobium bangladeshense]MBX4935254.1 GNAT family N-acetyltransferase [Rhizobium bangladeshense]MBX5242879.1 GNAT family N-acetyltransferase [Rhizobium sp. NLR22b]QSY91943.1 GNAT family N-acetyltransferase [Rhizobium bangladeshense]
MSTVVSFRVAERGDSQEIMRALRLLAESLGVPEHLKCTKEDIETAGFGPRREFTVMLAEVDDTIAGMSLYFPIFSTWMGKAGLYIQDLFVHEEFRDDRVGEKLLRHVGRTAYHDGYRYLRLTVDNGNEAGARFYLRHGFEALNNETSYGLYGTAFEEFAAVETKRRSCGQTNP